MGKLKSLVNLMAAHLIALRILLGLSEAVKFLGIRRPVAFVRFPRLLGSFTADVPFYQPPRWQLILRRRWQQLSTARRQAQQLAGWHAHADVCPSVSGWPCGRRGDFSKGRTGFVVDVVVCDQAMVVAL